MKSFKILFLSVFVVLQALTLHAQELRAKVTINAKQLTNVDPAIFDKMKTDVEEFLNLRKWTDDIYTESEKINCSVNITLDKVISQGKYKGSIYVLSSRPIYNTAYNSTVLKVLDNEFIISYDDFSIIEYTDNAFRSNFGSVLAYYANMIIGMDYDSFSEKGGDIYFDKAMDIIRNAQGEEEFKKGWRSTESNLNRYWLVENLINPKYERLRTFNKVFHLDILDVLHEKNTSAKLDLHTQVLELEDLKYYTTSYLLKTFLEIKADEIYNLATELDNDKQKDVKRIMSILNPTNKKLWNALGKEKSKGGKPTSMPMFEGGENLKQKQNPKSMGTMDKIMRKN